MLSAVAAWVKWRARTPDTVQQRTFHVWAVASSVLAPPGAAQFSGERLAAGMGAVRDELAVAHLPASPGSAGLSAGSATVISVPERCATRVAFAAAGCGLMATPWRGAVGPSEELPLQASAAPLPGWFLGLSTTGRPVCLYPVPGATVVVTGDSAAVDALLASIAWPDNAVRVVSVAEWEEAWDPAVMRVVAAPAGTDGLASEFVTATVAITSAPAQLSTITAGGQVLHFAAQNLAQNLAPDYSPTGLG